MDVTPVLIAYLVGNRGLDPPDPDRRLPPDYSVAATLHGHVLDLTLTLRRGRAYCCAEWGCHLGLFEGMRWKPLRRCFADAGIDTPMPLELRLTCVVEEGARFFDIGRPDPTRRFWYAFRESEAFRYEERSIEGDE